MISKAIDVKNWFLRNTYNAKITYYNGYATQLYLIGAIVSDEIKNMIINEIIKFTENASGAKYLGAYLAISDNIYTLVACFGGKKDNNGYIFGSIQFLLTNVIFDWEKYIKSKDFIKIDVPLENIFMYDLINQGSKNKKIFTNTRINTFNTDIYGTTDILGKKSRVRNVVGLNSTNAFFLGPTIYKYLSRTPSICILANLIYKSLKSCDYNCVEILNNNDDVSKHKHIC
jgi:hypothetical protein